jgi:hypothetical protein
MPVESVGAIRRRTRNFKLNSDETLPIANEGWRRSHWTYVQWRRIVETSEQLMRATGELIRLRGNRRDKRIT